MENIIVIWYMGGPSTIEKGMMIPEFSENREKIKHKNYIKLKFQDFAPLRFQNFQKSQNL